MNRRDFIKMTTASVLVLGLCRLMRSGKAFATEALSKLTKTNEEWKKLLTPAQYNVLREEGTERPFTSELLKEHREGTFACVACDLPLFPSKFKYESGTGWPSFFDAIPGHLETKTDNALFMLRTEYHCARCGGHHGHVFDDGPKPTGLRYCNNGVALKFMPKIVSLLVTALLLLFSPLAAQAGMLQDALSTPYKAPEFSGDETWLNSPPLTLSKLHGKVVLIDFWTYSCINCIRTLPYITQWDASYRDKGLVIIGVHAPEFHFEHNVKNIKRALAKYHITYPIIVDNDMKSWNAFKNKYWPAHYLIDKNGNVVYTHFGEGNYTETENNIRHLLGLEGQAEAAPEAQAPSNKQTPETYLGSARGARFSSPETLENPPKPLPADHWALSGKWRVEGERIVAEEAGAKLQLNFTAAKVFLVLGTQNSQSIKATLTLNQEPLENAAGKDAPQGILNVQHHSLYELVNQSSAKNGLLEITASAPGLEAYAFTFGN